MRPFLSNRLLILIGLLLTLQYSFSSLFFLSKGRVDLLYLLLLDYAFFWSWERVPFFAFAMGLLRDFIGGHLFGIETISLTLTGFFLYWGVQKLERESFWVRWAIGFLFVSLAETLSVSLGRGLEISKGLSFDSIQSIFETTLYTGTFAPVFFWLMNRWFRRSPVLKQYELFR